MSPAPWDVFDQGAALHLPLSLGTMIIATAGLVLGGIAGVGTLLFALAIGPPRRDSMNAVLKPASDLVQAFEAARRTNATAPAAS